VQNIGQILILILIFFPVIPSAKKMKARISKKSITCRRRHYVFLKFLPLAGNKERALCFFEIPALCRQEGAGIMFFEIPALFWTQDIPCNKVPSKFCSLRF
jgi:hypothetical protein